MKTLPLSQGRVALVSDEDFAELSKFKWTASLCSRKGWAPKWYAMRKPTVNGKRVTIYLHRAVATRAHGSIPEGLVVDHHPNPDGLDCRRENLRIVSHYENTKHAMFKPREEPWL